MPTTDPEAIAWLRSRPDSIKALIREFPPACMVIFKKDAPICDAHRQARARIWTVVSYAEDGDLGIAADYADMDNRVHVPAAHLDIYCCQEGQTKDWVNAILDGDQS